jgi:RNA polymerase sigma factor for flagellar operon FliA
VTAAALARPAAAPSGSPARRENPSADPCDELVTAHLPLVGHIVRDALTRLPAHINRDDLVSAGTLALVLAARSFDPARGVPFGRFAAIRIRGAITDELRTLDWASRAVRAKAREVDSVRGGLTARLGRTPTRVEVAQVMGVGVADLDALDGDVHRASVLNLQSLTADETANVLPATSETPDETLLRREQLGLLCDAIAELPERLRRVVEQYFFQGRKMTDIAAELGVTESRVSQLRSEALTLLRSGLTAGDEPAPATPARARSRAALQQAYSAAVTGRSTLGERLRATTLLGELRPNQV